MKPRTATHLQIAHYAFALVICAHVACTPTQRATVKTAVDVATEACHFAFGARPDELPPGVTLKDFCEVEENLQPFVDSILSTQQSEAKKLGTLRTRVLIHDAGTD